MASPSDALSAGLNAETARTAPASFDSLVGRRLSAASISSSKRARAGLSSSSVLASAGLGLVRSAARSLAFASGAVSAPPPHATGPARRAATSARSRLALITSVPPSVSTISDAERDSTPIVDKKIRASRRADVTQTFRRRAAF